MQFMDQDISKEVIHYMRNIVNALENIRKNIEEIESQTRETEHILHIEQEQKREKTFIKLFRILMILFKENVLFIYPQHYESDSYPNYILPYTADESIDDVYYKYSRQFFRPKLLNPYRVCFYSAELRNIMRGNYVHKMRNESFGSLGPIDFYLRLNE
jgi:hypothetical protein